MHQRPDLERKKKGFQNYCCRVCLSCSSSSQQVYYDANFLLYEPNQNFVDGILASSDPYSSIKAFRERIPTLLKVCLCIQDQLKFTFFIIWLRGSQAIIYMKWLPIAKGNFFATKTFFRRRFLALQVHTNKKKQKQCFRLLSLHTYLA